MLKWVHRLACCALLFFSAPLFAQTTIDSKALDHSLEQGVQYFRREQRPDGSWMKLIQVSSPAYNCRMIFLYEFLGQTEQKKQTVEGLINFVWAQQNKDGGIPGYPNAPVSDLGISAEAYLAAKIAGEDELSPRMLALEKFIKQNGGLSKAYGALPYLLAFQVNTNVKCLPYRLFSTLLSQEKNLPWAKVLLYPLFYLYTTDQTHRLSYAKHPKRLGDVGFCPKNMPTFFPNRRSSDAAFWSWMDANINDDGTMFDYTPTSIPTLMALSKGGLKYRSLLESGVRVLESLQQKTTTGIYQAPGESSVAEGYLVINFLMDAGLTLDDPMLKTSIDFVWSKQLLDTGGFGLARNSQRFPDSDDTSNATYTLLKTGNLSPLTAEQDRRLLKGVDWLVSLQNDDGGFGTWEKETAPLLWEAFSVASPITGFVFSESVPEHTARIVISLAKFRHRNAHYAKAYMKAMHYLLENQKPDGSYQGTWFVNYLPGTAMALAALGTNAKATRVQSAIERALDFVLKHQAADGGFSESPESFDREKVVPLKQSSPAQTGLIAAQLLAFLEFEDYAHWPRLKPYLDRAIAFLLKTRSADGIWNDKTWTGVTFPKVEYLIYPYAQELMPLQAIALYRKALLR